MNADPSGRVIYGACLRPLACWDWGFESRREHDNVSCKCCVLTGKGLYDGPIPRPEESYRVWVCVCVCVSLSVWSRSLNNEAARSQAELLQYKKKTLKNRLFGSGVDGIIPNDPKNMGWGRALDSAGLRSDQWPVFVKAAWNFEFYRNGSKLLYS